MTQRGLQRQFAADEILCKDLAVRRHILPQEFFNRATLCVARELIGKFLVRKYRGRGIAAMITEVEAYDGFHDKASHASRGMTARNAPMFGPAGVWYVYFTYGMHWMLNIVTREKGYPAAILIRGVTTVTPQTKIITKTAPADSVIICGVDSGSKAGMTAVINGPARLTKYFYIDKVFNGLPANRKTGLWIEDRGVRIKNADVARTPRIGVAYAGRVWASKNMRFLLNQKSNIKDQKA